MRVYTITSAQPRVHLYGSADDGRGMGEIASAYLVLGVEHILSGVDHLLFVLALLFLVGFNRRLVWTITAFTAAHSITLALSALGWLTLRSPPPRRGRRSRSRSCWSPARPCTAARRSSARSRTVSSRGGGFYSGWCMAWASPARSRRSAYRRIPPGRRAADLHAGVELGQLLVVGLAFSRGAPWRAGRIRHCAYAGAHMPSAASPAYWSFRRGSSKKASLLTKA